MPLRIKIEYSIAIIYDWRTYDSPISMPSSFELNSCKGITFWEETLNMQHGAFYRTISKELSAYLF